MSCSHIIIGCLFNFSVTSRQVIWEKTILLHDTLPLKKGVRSRKHYNELFLCVPLLDFLLCQDVQEMAIDGRLEKQSVVSD